MTTEIELILTMLGETSTKQIAVARDAQGFKENQTAAKAGGEVAGSARRHLESKLGQSVVSPKNHLKDSEPARDLLAFPESFNAKIDAIAANPPSSKPKGKK
jgi:hypothetical protein